MTKQFVIKCPECGYPQHCGCNEWCLSKVPAGTKPYTWTKNGEAIICAGCGFIGSADFWGEEEEKQYKQFKGGE